MNKPTVTIDLDEYNSLIAYKKAAEDSFRFPLKITTYDNYPVAIYLSSNEKTINELTKEIKSLVDDYVYHLKLSEEKKAETKSWLQKMIGW